MHDMQDRFSRAILENQPNIISDEILPDGLMPEERYKIYHNNTFITLGSALGQNFPVVCRLVGKRFFDQMAREYVRVYPPKTPLLMSYGDRMTTFLPSFKPVKGLPYLADVAQLEYLWNQSFNGTDSKDFDLDQLNNVAPEKFNDLIFRFLPNMRLMTSEFPVLEIWLANQEGTKATKEIDLDGGGCYLAIFRKAQDVEVMNLDPGSYCFLEQLFSGKPLGLATEETLEKHSDFDLPVALQNILHRGMIAGFDISQ